MALQLRPKCRRLPNPTLVRFFSNSTSRDPTPEDSSPTSQPSQSQSSVSSSYLSDVKSKLKHHQQFRTPFYASNHSPPASVEEITKNLAEFRRRSAVPSPPDSPSSRPVTVKELLKRNVIRKGVEAERETGPTRPVSHQSFETIRASLKQIRNNTIPRARGGDPLSLSSFKDSLKLKPPGDGSVFRGMDKLPPSVFGKEMRERESGKVKNDGAMKTEFVKVYSHEELGKKLRMLRPDGCGFSLEELNERLERLREMEDKETESRIGGIGFKELRDTLHKARMSADDKAKKEAFQGFDILGQMSQTKDFMLQPPKEHLVEQYFHPDNMSSEEKMKLELAKVREEFKMSESDCGSARVQVAQLTTKIKHLSSVLHKKDKHSRKGLQEMVQRRKKLLKYLRRTDWDSYCLVLSRFGLRDNPDFKH